MKNFKIKLTVLMLFMVAATFSGCGMLYMLNFSNLLVVGNSGAVQTISESEDQLLSDGPIDLPVTIAKYDSPDADKIDTTEVLGSINLIKSKIKNATSGSRTLRISGTAQAIREIEETPLLIGTSYDPATGDVGSLIQVDVNADGSFEIEAPTDSDAIIAASDEEGYASPFLQITKDPVTGYFTIVTTNSNSISATQQITVDDNDYYYLSLANSSGENSLVRRNVDGTELQEVFTAEDHGVDALVSPSGYRAVYSYESSADVATVVIELISVSTSSSLSSRSATASAVDPIYDTVSSYGYDLTTVDPYDFSDNQFKIFLTEDEQGVLILNRVDNSLNYVSTISANVSELIEANLYDDIQIAYDQAENNIYVWVNDDGLFSLFLLPLDDEPELAWQFREAIDEFVDVDDVLSMDAADGTLAYVKKTGSTYSVFYWTAASGEQTIILNSSTQYDNVKVSPAGDFVFACKISTPAQLVFNEVGVGSDLTALTGDSAFQTCGVDFGSYFVSSSFVHTYRSEADGTLPQHAVIPLDQL